ncbi:acyl-CoA dehydrogenase [Tistrella bauzanensis]|uniref:Acyl-CoA dehydrogenase n=1 Tax=Tistrella bauzanensis TaxID=657419 RepID=A0ABQ1J8D1_9PROT|nr:acyl-CoA dehydrogenase family protein [Tistrella bauzanensis]GGB62315.1 acyl-CoA dehydrogenase [Tistrella bauzanensis]
MDIMLSADEQAFADEVRQFIRDNLPADIADKVRRDQHLGKDDHMRWQQILGARGWHAFTWPAEHGGPGWTITQRYLFEVISAEMDCPLIQPFGPRMAGPVIYSFGTQEQRDRFLPGIRDSTIWWCQGYSEPQSGSDLASLATRAEDAGDHYIVNGQKIWTSYAHHADWMFCLVRTAKEDKPQKGISFLLIDMKTPGITVQPIPMLEGTHSFNTVFFEDVKVPKANRIGEEGKGWTYAKFLLEHERVDNAAIGVTKAALRRLKQIAATEPGPDDRPLIEDPLFAARVTAVEAQLMSLELAALRTLSAVAAGGSPGPASSLLKIRGTEIAQKISELGSEATGYYALPWQPGRLDGTSNEEPVGPEHAGPAANAYLWRRCMSIYGGSNEIQRNIIAKQMLGL